MSRVVIYCFGDQAIWNAAQMMETYKIRRLPVLNRDMRLVGIVSLGDLAVRTSAENIAGRILEHISEPTPQIARI
jgi:CBS domain-containing protein